MKILLVATGSVAAILVPRIVDMMLGEGHEVCVVATEPSLAFWNRNMLRVDVNVYRDADEWPLVYQKGDPILHIELRSWADIVVIAPLSANTLAKMAHGIADNLATSVMRAWDLEKPVIVTPAMNTLMWQHPVTAEQLAILSRWYKKFFVIHPVEKELACGDFGVGAMAPIDSIKDIVAQIMC